MPGAKSKGIKLLINIGHFFLFRKHISSFFQIFVDYAKNFM